MRLHTTFLGTLSLAALLAACGGSASPAVPTSASAAPGAAASGGVKLTGAGSTFDFPLFTKVFDAWGKQTGGQVNYQSVGSGAGIEQLSKKTVDFGASDAIMTADQEKAAGAPVVHL